MKEMNTIACATTGPLSSVYVIKSHVDPHLAEFYFGLECYFEGVDSESSDLPYEMRGYKSHSVKSIENFSGPNIDLDQKLVRLKNSLVLYWRWSTKRMLMGIGGIDDFLQRKGSVEIIVEIGFGSTTFQNIEKAVLVSSSTISNRLNEGVKTGLIDVTHRPTEYGTQKRYELTNTGSRVFDWIQETDMDSTVRELQRVQRKRDNELENLLYHVANDRSLQETQDVPSETPPEEAEMIPEEAEMIPEEAEMISEESIDDEAKREHMEKKRREKLESDLIRDSNLDNDTDENEDS